MLFKVHRDVKCAASRQDIKRKVGGTVERQSSRSVDAALQKWGQSANRCETLQAGRKEIGPFVLFT